MVTETIEVPFHSAGELAHQSHIKILVQVDEDLLMITPGSHIGEIRSFDYIIHPSALDKKIYRDANAEARYCDCRLNYPTQYIALQVFGIYSHLQNANGFRMQVQKRLPDGKRTLVTDFWEPLS